VDLALDLETVHLQHRVEFVEDRLEHIGIGVSLAGDNHGLLPRRQSDLEIGAQEHVHPIDEGSELAAELPKVDRRTEHHSVRLLHCIHKSSYVIVLLTATALLAEHACLASGIFHLIETELFDLVTCLQGPVKHFLHKRVHITALTRACHNAYNLHTIQMEMSVTVL